MKSYDLRTFTKKQIRDFVKLWKCLKKRLPLRLVFLCDCDIDAIPPGTRFSHPFGICINAGTRVGKNVDIRHGVTIGTKDIKNNHILPCAEIGDNVFIGCNASILGSVRIGNNAIIGAHALVLADVPENTTVVGTWK